MIRKHIQKAVLRLFPELSGGLHLDRYARVLAIADAPDTGASSERFRPRYAVDIEVLTPELEPDSSFPQYTAVPLPIPFGAGDECGSFAFPHPGTLVVVGFAYGRQDHPIIRQIYPMGETMPHVETGEIVIQRSPEVTQKADKAGNWTRTTNADITDESVTRHVRAQESKTELTSETKLVSEHAHTEVDGTSTLEVGTNLTMLAGTHIEQGTLGTMNTTAGTHATTTVGENATEVIGNNHASTVKNNRSIAIEGGRVKSVAKGQNTSIGKDNACDIGGNNDLAVNGDHSDQAGGDRSIAATNIALQAKNTFTITSEKGGGINFIDEVIGAFDDVHAALQKLSEHTHPDTGRITQGDSVASDANAEMGHVNRLRLIRG